MLKYLFLISLAMTCFASASSTDPSRFKVADGFNVELVYEVPKDKQGSWVSMTNDSKGRLIVSDQVGSLYRIDVSGKKAKVEKIEVDTGMAQGLLCAFDALYVMVNGGRKIGSYLVKVTDTDGDDKYDTKEELINFNQGTGEHGPHALLLGPDKKSIYMVVGNQLNLPKYKNTLVPPLWGEDQLLPRIYGKGYMKGVTAPRGFIAKMDKNAENIEIIATGFRNQYDAALNREGELFTFDADMEWDINTPWYRPTRVNHVTSGAEFGWRNGSAKLLNHHPDNLPTTLDIGPGSPSGVAFGYGAAFPEKYQEAFFICDWSYGVLYAVHLQPDGATFKAKKEVFISGQPLPLTDILVNPKDNALYFTTGGRQVQSALYRVTYTGNEKVISKDSGVITKEAKLRRELEEYHGPNKPEAVAKVWPHLSHSDRHIRWAARTAIEHQDVEVWAKKALAETNPEASLEALLALSRAGGEKHKSALIKNLLKLDWSTLTKAQKLSQLRILNIVSARMGGIESAKTELLGKFDSQYPNKDTELNMELAQIMVYLQSETAVAKTVKLLEKAPSQEEQIHYAKTLRLAKTGWTDESYKKLFNWFTISSGYGGGASFKVFMSEIKRDTLKLMSKDAKARLQSAINAKVTKTKSRPNPALQLIAKRGSFTNWKVSDFKEVVAGGLKGRNFENGKNFYGAANCTACHRFNGSGGIIGPDLSGSGGRFAPLDLLEAVIEPSKQISDQYGSVILNMKDGTSISGKIANMKGDELRIITNLYSPGEMTKVDNKQVKDIVDSKVSMMPPGLINMMTQEEVLDLLAYVLSRGDKTSSMFK
ncbi:MAG: c-type cytochrome [Lentisphaeraceae bacterium]|nr:c-type cytochrome [Lentisphaeraceae bacterium]